jgi:hypothetical protein
MTERDRPRGWEASRQASLDAALEATPAQRLAWLEEALELAYSAGALPKRPAPNPLSEGEGGAQARHLPPRSRRHSRA